MGRGRAGWEWYGTPVFPPPRPRPQAADAFSPSGKVPGPPPLPVSGSAGTVPGSDLGNSQGERGPCPPHTLAFGVPRAGGEGHGPKVWGPSVCVPLPGLSWPRAGLAALAIFRTGISGTRRLPCPRARARFWVRGRHPPPQRRRRREQGALGWGAAIVVSPPEDPAPPLPEHPHSSPSSPPPSRVTGLSPPPTRVTGRSAPLQSLGAPPHHSPCLAGDSPQTPGGYNTLPPQSP